MVDQLRRDPETGALSMPEPSGALPAGRKDVDVETLRRWLQSLSMRRLATPTRSEYAVLVAHEVAWILGEAQAQGSEGAEARYLRLRLLGEVGPVPATKPGPAPATKPEWFEVDGCTERVAGTVSEFNRALRWICAGVLAIVVLAAARHVWRWVS